MPNVYLFLRISSSKLAVLLVCYFKADHKPKSVFGRVKSEHYVESCAQLAQVEKSF